MDMQAFQRQLKAIYSQSLETKKNWYSEVAVAYDQARPRYPKQILEQVITVAQLSPGARILEIGCGPGIATTALAELGFAVVGIEPSLAASQLAQQHCHTYPHVQICHTTFEEWHLEPKAFDAVFATTSFHWLSPEVACQKAAAALRDQGFLVLLWNTPPQPGKNVYQTWLQPIFQAYAPSLSGYEDISTHETYLHQFGQQVLDSGYFQDLVTGQHISEMICSVDRYLLLLSTLSPYIRLEPAQREQLLLALQETLKANFSEGLSTRYLSAFHLAQKKKI